MNAENKDQKEHQKELEKESNEVKGSNHYGDILKRVIHEGENLYKIKSKSMFLSGIIAGLEIGFSYLLICMLYHLLGGKLSQEVVILGNLLGGILFTLFIANIGPRMNLFTHETMVKVGTHVLNYDSWVLLLSGIMAGWLMGLLTWLMNSNTNTFARIFLVFMITGVIGFGGFHHSIVGNLEVFGAFLYSDTLSLWDYIWFLFLVLLGNGIGGSVVVGLFKYRIFASNHEKDQD